MNKNEFLALAKKPKLIHIKALNADIHLVEFSYRGAIEISRCSDPVERAVFSLINSVSDESGKLLFGIDDIESLSELFSFPVISEIAEKATALSTPATDAATVKQPAS